MKRRGGIEKREEGPETDLNGNVIVPHYGVLQAHRPTLPASRICTSSHRYTILQMMHVQRPQGPQKTFMDYIKLSPPRR